MAASGSGWGTCWGRRRHRAQRGVGGARLLVGGRGGGHKAQQGVGGDQLRWRCNCPFRLVAPVKGGAQPRGLSGALFARRHEGDPPSKHTQGAGLRLASRSKKEVQTQLVLRYGMANPTPHCTAACQPHCTTACQPHCTAACLQVEEGGHDARAAPALGRAAPQGGARLPAGARRLRRHEAPAASQRGRLAGAGERAGPARPGAGGAAHAGPERVSKAKEHKGRQQGGGAGAGRLYCTNNDRAPHLTVGARHAARLPTARTASKCSRWLHWEHPSQGSARGEANAAGSLPTGCSPPT